MLIESNVPESKVPKPFEMRTLPPRPLTVSVLPETGVQSWLGDELMDTSKLPVTAVEVAHVEQLPNVESTRSASTLTYSTEAAAPDSVTLKTVTACAGASARNNYTFIIPKICGADLFGVRPALLALGVFDELVWAREPELSA